MFEIEAAPDGSLRVPVLVQPRAARSEVVGLHGDALKVRLAAPPADGAANRALCEILARTLGCRDREVSVIAGAASRRKVVALPARVRDALEQLMSAG